MSTSKHRLLTLSALGLAALALGAAPSFAQAPPASPPPPLPPYGAPMTLDTAKKAMAAAEAEAKKNNWSVAIAILDTTGTLVLFQKLDNTSNLPVAIAQGKARTALDTRRPTKTLQDAIAGGGAGLRVLGIRDATPLEGGVPVIVDGKVVGAIGTSGVLSDQDAQVSKAGADAAAAK
ncbi:MAG: heme-binding protein [Acetobacteraceae bacterium]|nr:heme-binding protein [Acetobacteraceae bacterium]